MILFAPVMYSASCSSGVTSHQPLGTGWRSGDLEGLDVAAVAVLQHDIGDEAVAIGCRPTGLHAVQLLVCGLTSPRRIPRSQRTRPAGTWLSGNAGCCIATRTNLNPWDGWWPTVVCSPGGVCRGGLTITRRWTGSCQFVSSVMAMSVMGSGNCPTPAVAPVNRLTL